MTALVRLAGRAASWSRGAGITAPRGLVLLPQRRTVFQGARMDNGGGKGGRGALIVLEGLDKSGKSSQCARLLSFLQGKGCAIPDRDTGVGKMISAYLANKSQLDDRTIHLLFSANRLEKRGLMESKLLGGTTLVVDRSASLKRRPAVEKEKRTHTLIFTTPLEVLHKRAQGHAEELDKERELSFVAQFTQTYAPLAAPPSALDGCFFFDHRIG